MKNPLRNYLMRHVQPLKNPRLAFSLALGLALLTAAPAPAQIAFDKMHGYAILGTASYTTNGGGHTLKPTDLAMDLGTGGGTLLTVTDPAFFTALNAGVAGDQMTVSLWAQLSSISQASGFFFYSPGTTTGTQRGFQAHLPWSDDNIYFDTAGCCDGTLQRINASITTFPPYVSAGIGDAWWNTWHHFVFLKNGSDKQIWIDGVLFREGQNSGVLPTDFNLLAVGSGIPQGIAGSLRGQIDDFAVYTTALTSNQVIALATGTAPDALTGTTPLAYWDFNPPAQPLLTTIHAGPGATVTPDVSAFFVIANGGSAVQVNTIQVGLNTSNVTAQATILPTAVVPVFPSSSAGATIYYTSPTVFAAGTTQTVWLTYSDNATPPNVFSNSWPVIIEPYNGFVTDTVSNRRGFLEGSAVFTLDKGGHTAAAGDRAIDLSGVGSGGSVHVGTGSFLNPAASNGIMSVSLWMKMHVLNSGAAFYARSLSSSGGQRGYATRFWNDDTIYFDTAGCCDTTMQEVSVPIAWMPTYTNDTFWSSWHNFVFTFNNSMKSIWVDGIPLVQGAYSGNPLPTDFHDLFMGYDPGDNAYQQAVIDDVAVFSTELSATSISSLTNKVSPTALAGETLLAYWDFNTVSPGPPFISLASTPVPNSTNNLPNVGANIIILNRDTQVQTNTITLALDGTNMTSLATITSNSAGANITFLAPAILPRLSTHKLTVVFSDNATPPNLVSNTWSFGIGNYGGYAMDVMHGYLGMFRGNNTHFTPAGGGHTGASTDRSLDLYVDGGGGATVTDPPFLAAANAAAGLDNLTVSFWLRQAFSRDNNSAVWFNSPSVGRDFQAHTPYGNTIYFDTAGCCNAPQRVSAGIGTFAGYQAVGNDGWWTNWHHFVLVKESTNKTIYIDGQPFLAATSAAAPLTTDINALYMGFGSGIGSAHGQLDDFVVYGDPLTPTAVGQLYSGTSPLGIGATNVIAYWPFNDVGPAFLVQSSRTPGPGATGRAAYGPPAYVSAQMIDGATTVNTNTVRLLFNGTDVTGQAAITLPSSGVTQIRYAYAPTFASKLASGSTNTVALIFSDNATPPNQNSNSWTFVTEVYTGVTRDLVKGYPGLIWPAGRFTTNGAGRTGLVGDYAFDTTASGGAVHVDDATFLYPAETNNAFTLSVWVRKYDIASASAIWVTSPSSSGTGRGINVHLPWSNDNIYYDTAGCCDGTLQRLNWPINTFAGYTAAAIGDGWWTNWHHFVFRFNAGAKDIWIDGQQWQSGNSTSPLPLDFTDMFLGRNVDGNVNMHGVIDDFSAFSTVMDPTNIVLLAGGAVPTSLNNETLLAYWNFNDAPTLPTLAIARSNATVVVTYTGTLQSATNVVGPYLDMTGAPNPYTTPATGPAMFYRARQ